MAAVASLRREVSHLELGADVEGVGEFNHGGDEVLRCEVADAVGRREVPEHSHRVMTGTMLNHPWIRKKKHGLMALIRGSRSLTTQLRTWSI